MSTQSYVVEITQPNHKAERREYTDGRVIFGRSRAHAHLVVSDDQLSGRHCEMTFLDGRVQVVDLNSTNGTWLGGKRQIHRFELKKGQRFRAGNVRLALVSAPGDAPEPMQKLAEVTRLPALTRLPTVEPARVKPRPKPPAAAKKTSQKPRRKHHVTKLFLLIGAILGLAAFVVPSMCVDLDELALDADAAAATPAFIADGFATVARMDGEHSALTLVRTLTAGADVTADYTATAEASAEQLAQVASQLDGAAAEAQAAQMKEAAEAARLATEGAGKGMRVMAGLIAVPYFACGLLGLIGVLGVFIRFGRLMGAATLLVGLAGFAGWALQLSLFARVPFLSPAMGFYVLAAGLALATLSGLAALFVPEPKRV